MLNVAIFSDKRGDAKLMINFFGLISIFYLDDDSMNTTPTIMSSFQVTARIWDIQEVKVCLYIVAKFVRSSSRTNSIWELPLQGWWFTDSRSFWYIYWHMIEVSVSNALSSSWARHNMLMICTKYSLILTYQKCVDAPLCCCNAKIYYEKFRTDDSGF